MHIPADEYHVRSLPQIARPEPIGGALLHERLSAVPSLYLALPRHVDVYLPPGYAHDHHRHYPILYLNDGQDVDALDLPATLAHLYAEQRLMPMILVAIHASRQRLQEYGTAGITNAQGLGSLAADYSCFLRRELMPTVARRYRVAAGPQNTAVAGFSLGGLSAFDTCWLNPDVFGAVGVFSGSFWWRADDSSVRARLISRIMHRRVRTTEHLPHLRMWMQAGTEDETADRDGDGVIDAIQDTLELIDTLAERGYRRGVDMSYVQIEGGRHDQATWGRVMPQFLTWLWPRHVLADGRDLSDLFDSAPQHTRHQPK